MYKSAYFDSTYNHTYITKIYRTWEFPGSPVVRTQSFLRCGPGLICSQETKTREWLGAPRRKKSNKGKAVSIYKGMLIRLSADFPAETLQGRKAKNLQPRILYLGRFSFSFDQEVRSFTDKQKLREFSTTKSALAHMPKELL